MTNRDLTQPDVITKDYYSPSKNGKHGDNREKNIKKHYNNKESNAWEIKTDYQIRQNLNVFFETHQILYSETEWRESGLSLPVDIWHIGIPNSDNKDFNDLSMDNPIIKHTKTIWKIIEKYIKSDDLIVRGRGTLPLYVWEGDKPYYTYTSDSKTDKGYWEERHSRGILVPLHILLNPFYLEDNGPKLVWEYPSTEEQVNKADEHLCNYLVGDGDINDLYEYYNLMDKNNIPPTQK